MAVPSFHRSPPQSRWGGGSFGFTLIEVLLSIALLVTLAAILAPAFGDLLANRRVARSGEQLRTEMMRARMEAMRSGRTFVLQLKSGGHQLRVMPWVSAADTTEAMDQTGSGAGLLSGGNLPGATQAVDIEALTRQVELPEIITVADVTVQSTQRSFMVEGQMQAQGSDGWGQPLLFFADGSTSTAAITLSAEGVGRVMVLLRGLTGEVGVSEVLAPQERPSAWRPLPSGAG